MAGERRTRVFVSYARADAARVAPLAEALKAAGHDVLLDVEAIAKAEEWQARLGKLISSADAVAFFLSPASAGSSVCGWEVETAEQLGKRIVPVVIERVGDAAVPAGLARRNYIFATDGSDTARAAGEIAGAVGTDIGWVREHTRLTELAGRWQERQQPADQLLRGRELSDALHWLAAVPPADLAATPLQRTFIALSQKAQGRRRVTTAGTAALVALLLAGGGLVLYEQRRQSELARAAEARRAVDAVTDEVLSTARKLDARLGFVLVATRELEQTAASSLPTAFTAETNRILAEQRIGSLRQKLNGVPLNADLRAEMLRQAGLTKADPALIGTFYDSLASATDSTEDVFEVLDSAAKEVCTDPAVAPYHADRRTLAARALRHQSNVVLHNGLAVLWSLGADRAAVVAGLAGLTELSPRAMPPDGPAHGELLAQDLIEQSQVLAERRRLGEVQKAVNDRCISGSVTGLASDLAIKPEDGAREIIIKARRLRQLGSVEEAVAYFSELGRRFPDAFPQMTAYVEAASAFSRNVRLPPQQLGGVYLDAVQPGGTADAAGLRAGDIVLSYGGTPVGQVEEMQAAIAAHAAGNAAVEIRIVRRDPQGRYSPQQLLIEPAPRLGISMRPI